MSTTMPTANGEYVAKRISISTIIQIVLILGTMIAGWYRFDYRVSRMEMTVQQVSEQQARTSIVMEKLDRTLDLLNQRLQDFPLHRHIPGGGIDYPYGTRNQYQSGGK